MDQMGVEEVGRVMRRAAAYGVDETPLALDVAERLLGEGSVVYGAATLPARLVGHAIVIPIGHPDLNFAVAHELAEWALRELVRWDGSHAQTERAANAIAAAILAPPAAVVRAYAHYGERTDELAAVFGLSQTALILRLAEVSDERRAVVTRSGHVLARMGQLSKVGRLVGDAAQALRDAASSPRETPGLARARLVGGIDEGRVALRVRW